MFHLSSKVVSPVAALLFSAALAPLQAQSTSTSGVTITVTSSANPSVFAAPVTLTIVVAGPTAASATPTGTIQATLGSLPIGQVPLNNSGEAFFTFTQPPSPLASFPWSLWVLPAGSDTITFAYSGDSNYKAAQSSFTQFVKKADTTTTLTVKSTSQGLHLVATVSILNPAAGSSTQFSLPGNLGSTAPTGTVTFTATNPLTALVQLLGTATLTPTGPFTSTAVLDVTTSLPSISASYGGDNNYNSSVSAPVTSSGNGTVNLSVTSSGTAPTFAEPVMFSVTVAAATSGGAVPTGTVTANLLGLYKLGSTTLDGTGKGAIVVPSSMTSAIPWGLPAGSDSIAFSYGGDANYSAAQTTFTQTVDKAATATTATLSAAETSITATVAISPPVGTSPSAPFALPGPAAQASNPSGQVQFLNGATVIGTVSLTPSGNFQSSAKLTVAQPFASGAVLTAVYNGDSNYTGSTSPAATVPNLPAVTLSVQSSANPATFAEPVTLTIKVTPAAANNATPSGTVQASIFGSYVLGASPLDSTGTASITVPPQVPAANSVVPWGLPTGSDAITVTYSGDTNFAPGQTTFNQTVNQSNTTTTVAIDPLPVPTNTAAYKATVSIDEPSVSKTEFNIPSPESLSTSPTGRVAFYDGTTLLGTTALAPSGLFQSTAVFIISPIPSSIRAVYYGDDDYNGSSSQSSSQGNGPVTVTLQSSASPNLFGAALTVVATVAPATSVGPTPTGTLQFFDGAQNLAQTVTLNSSGEGTLKFPIPEATPQVCFLTCPPPANALVLGGGSHSVTAQYSGDVNYAAATSAPLTQQITKAPTTTTVSAFAATYGLPSASGVIATVADAQPPAGGPYHFQAMTPSGAVDGDPSGTVTFYSGSTSIGTGTLTPSLSGNVTSTATLNTTNITTTGNFSASYPGDANFQASNSPTLATSVSLSASPNPSTTGQSVTLTATIATASTTPAPTGTVSFLDGKMLLGTTAVSGGTATLGTTFTTAGSHSLTATYNGDANYQGSTSAVYTQTVNGSTIPTDTLKLTVSTTTAVYGQHVVLFVQVIGNVTTPPTGTVNFLDGSTNIGSATLAFNTAYIVVTLAVGTHQISATWAGDSNWPAAKSSTVTLTVNRAATAVRLTSFDSAWTAVVIAVPPGEGTPTGSVQFVDTKTQAVLATATLSNGSATVTLTSVTDPIQVVYSGDSNFSPSQSRDNSTLPPRPRR